MDLKDSILEEIVNYENNSSHVMFYNTYSPYRYERYEHGYHEYGQV